MTLVENRIAADSAIRDRQIRELANQYIEVLGDEYTDEMEALTDLELVQHWQLRSQLQQARYERNLPHFGTEARNWLVRRGVKGAGLMTDEEAIAAVPKEQLKIRLSKCARRGRASRPSGAGGDRQVDDPGFRHGQL